MTTLIDSPADRPPKGAEQRVVVLGLDGPEIEDDALVLDPPDHRRLGLAEAHEEVGGAADSGAQRETDRWDLLAGQRATDQLVAGERHDVGTEGQPLPRGRLVGETEPLGREQGATAQVVDEDGAALVGEIRQLPWARRLDEPRLDEVRGVDAEDDADR